MNFETGDFTGWEIDIGTRLNENDVDYDADFFRDINDHIRMMTPTVPPIDEYGIICETIEIPTVFPGGQFSARIGDLDGGKVASKVSKTFTVTENESYLLYSYAIILQEPGHSEAEQPKFVVNIRNNDGDIVTCGQFEAFAGPNAEEQGFSSCELPRDYECDFPLTECPDAFPRPFNIIQILPWTSGGADLRPYLGQEITIEFVILDCLQGGHGASAYLEASIADLNVSVDSFCETDSGSSLTLTAPLGFVSYLWSTGETTQTITINNPVEGDVYTVDLISNTGCNTTTEVTLSIKPAAEIDPIPDQTICKGGSVTIAPTGTNADSFYIPEVDTTGISFVLSPEVTTTYTVFPLNENSCRGESTTFTIEVLEFNGSAFPEAAFEIEPVLDTPETCNRVNFINNSSYCRGGLTYEWDFGDGSPISTEENPTYTYPDTTDQITYIITLTITTPDGDTATATGNFQSRGIAPSFDVLPPECAKVTVLNTSMICDASFADNTFYTYSWDFGDGTVQTTDQTTAELTHVYAATGIYTITMTMENTVNNVTYTASDIVEIVATLTADFEFKTDSCLTIDFRDLSTFCEPITAYTWDFGDGSPSSTEESPSHTYTSVGPHTVRLTVADGTTTDTIEQIITLTPQASTPSFSYVQQCDALVFTDTSTSCWDTLTYSWDFGDGSPVVTDQNPKHTFVYGNTYEVVLTIDDGVAATSIRESITVAPAFVYETPQDLDACGIPGAIEADFNLQSQTDRILSNVTADTPTPPVVTYYTSLANAEAAVSPVGIQYTALEASQMIYARIDEAEGCSTILSFTITVGRTPAMNSIEDIFLCLEEGINTAYDLTQLNARFFDEVAATNTVLTYHLSTTEAMEGTNAVTSVTLQTGDPVTVIVRAAATESMCYTLTEFTLRVDNRETDEDSRCFLQISNAMTPNGDGSNDHFMIANIETFPQNTVVVYNRWGNRVFEDSGYENTWLGTYQGKPLPVGTYYYVVALNDAKNRKYSGYVSIIR